MRPRFLSRRHWAFISETVSEGLSSMRMSIALSAPAAVPTRRHSSSERRPVWSFLLSTRPSPASRRMTSCSRVISSENTATVLPVDFAALSAMFRPMLVLPMPGRDATRMKSPGPMPRMVPSSSLMPVEMPGVLLSESAASEMPSYTRCTTVATGSSPPVLRSLPRAKILRSAASRMLSAVPPPS